jgi:dsDNA-binding SOS-regulon protein
MARNIDLNVDNSDNITTVLRHAAEQFEESQSELSSAWQDENAGYVWHVFANALERGIRSIDKLKVPHEVRELLDDGDFDLDVDTPEKVPDVLREAAENFRKHDKKSIWYKIGVVLDRVARSCDTAIRNYV